MTEKELKEYIANLEKSGGQTIGPGPGAAQARVAEQQRQARFTSDVAASLSAFPDIRPQGDQTALPAIFSITGGLAPLVAPQARVIRPIAQLGRGTALAPYAPSLAGSTIGSVFGTVLEPALTGQDYMSSTFAGRLIGNIVENAVWDVAGNLTFQIGGKTFKAAKDAFKSGTAGTTDPRVAAQEWLSNRGATLTRGQLEDSATGRTLEKIARSGFGETALMRQQEGVSKAVSSGIQEVKDTLQTSAAFKLALASEEPFTRAAGENFQELIKLARDEFKNKYRPFYDGLTQNNGVYVDLRSIKQAAQQEYDQLAKSKFKGAAAERKEVLDDVLAQDDFVEFGVAHDLRSNFSGAADDLTQPGKGTTTKGAAYTKYAASFEKAMDDAVLAPGKVPGQFGTFQTPLSKDTVDEYNRVKKLYSEGKKGLYNETIIEAMQLSKSKVGAYLADLSESEKFTDLFRAISTIDQYVQQQGKQGIELLNDVKYSFLENNLSNPQKAAAFARNLAENKDLNNSFYKLFRSEAPQLKEILNAAQIGLEEGPAGSYFRNKVYGAAGLATGGAFGYIALPDSAQNKISEAFPQIATTAGVFLLTPKIIARAVTDPQAMDALAGLAKASQQPRYAGAAFGKTIDLLNKSGVIDSEYVTTVNNFFNAPVEQPTQQVPTTGPVDIQKYLQELEGQP